MHKTLLRLALITAAFVPAATALAADLDVPPPPPPVEELRPATYDWTGAYAGLQVGTTCAQGTLTEHRAAVVGPPAIPAADVEWENSGCGFKGGVELGYLHQFDNFVLGAEVDWARTNDIAKNKEVGGDFSFRMNHEVTLRARAGYAMDDTLLFLTAGGAWAQGSVSGINFGLPNDAKGSHFGWTVGAGVEHAVTDQFRLKLDYLYTRYNGKSYSDACCNFDVNDFDNHEVRLHAIFAF